MAPARSSARRFRGTTAIVVYSLCVLVIMAWAEWKTRHPGYWTAALAASIPVFAACLGAFLNNRSDEN